MYRYRAFGLTIGSDVRLDELAPQPDESAKVDLRIVRSDLGETIPPLGHYARFDFEGPKGVEMMWPGAASITTGLGATRDFHHGLLGASHRRSHGGV